MHQILPCTNILYYKLRLQHLQVYNSVYFAFIIIVAELRWTSNGEVLTPTGATNRMAGHPEPIRTNHGTGFQAGGPGSQSQGFAPRYGQYSNLASTRWTAPSWTNNPTDTYRDSNYISFDGSIPKYGNDNSSVRTAGGVNTSVSAFNGQSKTVIPLLLKDLKDSTVKRILLNHSREMNR